MTFVDRLGLRVPVAGRTVLIGVAAAAGTMPWAALVSANTRHQSALPWAVPLMAMYLWWYWRHLVRGAGWPQSTAEARRLNARAVALPDDVWGPALLAGMLGLASVLLLQGVLSRFVALPQQRDLKETRIMNAGGDRRVTFLIPFILVVVSAAAYGQTQPAASSSLETRAAREAFLSKANIVNDGAPRSDATRSWRVSLDDGTQKHDAGVETADGSDPTGRNYRFNVAAYELNKALGLNLVPPSVERLVNGRAASLTWWVDNFSMNELDRRRKGIDPPDPERWNRQVQAVRVFDELISNTYRDPSPPLYLNTVWDNLLITRDWTVWITDHTGAFRIRRRLENPESLTRCDRALLDGLRELNRARLQRTLGKYFSRQQVDALEVRRKLLVKHFDDRIARNGQAAVVYDLAPKQ